MGVKAGFPIVCAPMNQGRGKQSDAEFFAAGQGASFVVENEPDLAAFSCLSYWPSSTRAELVAIFMALLTALPHAQITIYTDSLCAIQALTKIIAPILGTG